MKVLLTLAILTLWVSFIIAPLFLLNLRHPIQKKQPDDKEDEPGTHFMRG